MKNIGIAIRSLFKRGQHNVMKIISLGIGLTIGLVLIAKVHFENTYDNFYPDGDRIYRVYEKFFMNGEVGDHGQTPAGVIPLLKQETPEIEAATRYTYFRGNSPFTMSDNKHRLKATFILADSCLFDVLPRPMLIGDPKQVLSQPMYVLVSDEIAERIGGNVMGKRFEIDDAPGQALTIGGVFKKLPDNTEQSYDIIVSLSSISKFMWDGTHMLTGNDRYQSYVKVSPGTTEAQLEAGMRQMIDKHFPVNDLKKAGVELTFTFHKLLNVHMEDDMAKRMALILSFIAFVLIFTAVMNYILIVISSIVNRTKEMAVRKCYGASGKVPRYGVVRGRDPRHRRTSAGRTFDPRISRNYKGADRHGSPIVIPIHGYVGDMPHGHSRTYLYGHSYRLVLRTHSCSGCFPEYS